MNNTLESATIADGGRTVAVDFGQGLTGTLNRFWLRDHGPSLGERATLERGWSIAETSEDLAITSVVVEAGQLIVDFSDGAVERFGIDMLRVLFVPADNAPSVRTWRAGHSPTSLAWADLTADNRNHHTLLEALASDGLALVEGVPSQQEATEALAALLGPIRETDFGRLFNIVSEPDPFTPSQSTQALDPHTDDPYRYSPAGVSFLHCVKPSPSGGGSIVVDGFAVAEDLRQRDEAAFEKLSSVPVPFVHRRDETVDQGVSVDLRASAPMIKLDSNGVVIGVRFHERSMGTLALDADSVEVFYLAFRQFAAAVRSSDYQWQHQLEAGQALVYDNQRVLHGRTAISVNQNGLSTGKPNGTSENNVRHIRLGTVDRDQVHSKLRQLRRVYKTGSGDEVLPAGNLS